MLPIFLYALAVIAALIHMWYGSKGKSAVEVLLSYIIFFNIGIMGLIGFIMHVFFADETARAIGWPTGSPFQFEMGIANLTFGILGILAYWIRGNFWTATILGVSILMLGCFVGHVYQYYTHGNLAPYNIGPMIWFNDFFMPIIYLSLLYIWLTGSFIPPQADHLGNDNPNK